MRWTDPLWLIALLALVPLVYFGRDVKKSRVNRFLVIRCVAVALLVLAAAGTQILLPTQGQRIVVVFDASESVGNSYLELSRNAAIRIMGTLGPEDRVAILSAGATPKLLAPMANPVRSGLTLRSLDLSAADARRSDLGAALLTAKTILDGEDGYKRILFFTDGLANAGSDPVVAFQSVGGIVVDTVPVGAPIGGVRAAELEVPETVRPGEPAVLRWKANSDKERKATLELRSGGKLVSTVPVELGVGRNSVDITLSAGFKTSQELQAELFAPDGTRIESASTGAVLNIGDAASVLVVHGDTWNPQLAASLRIQGLVVKDGPIDQLPDSPAGYANLGSVVLDNVAALLMSESQQKELQNFVLGGGGLLVIGGDQSLGRGEYYATALEDLLPVSTDTRRRIRFTRTKILFVLDHSGSMTETVGSTSKLLAAIRGISLSIPQLSPQDEVGILGFDTAPTWILPFTPASKKAIITDSLKILESGGGTDLGAALAEVLADFSDPGPVRRHIVIITDGLTSDKGLQEIATRLNALGVSATCIGVGDEVNEELLKNISKWGDGTYYRANMDTLPSIINRETVRLTRDLIQEAKTPVVRVNDQGILQGIGNGTDGRLPPIDGYLITKLKPQATMYIQTGGSPDVPPDPVLAAWRYGAGKVAVFTSDSGARWLSSWNRSASFNRLWSQTIRSIERGSKASGLRVSASVQGSHVLVSADVLDANRELVSGLSLSGADLGAKGTGFQLKETSSGHYEANVALSDAGLHYYEIQESSGLYRARAWTWQDKGTESSSSGPDTNVLGQLSAAHGGHLESIEMTKLSDPTWAWYPRSLSGLLLLFAALALVLELGLRSTLFGQWSMIRYLIREAIHRQSNLMYRLKHPEKKVEVTSERLADQQKKIVDAYIKMAQMQQKRKEGRS